ncbi:MAG: hypothetical protein LBQ19_02990, partial [Synergistaceae bacterium]|nr:hypothetical protein [Synergistaceae bacterium]
MKKKNIRRRQGVFAILILSAALFISSPTGACLAADDDPSMRAVPVERQTTQGSTNRTPHFALIKEHADPGIPPDVWVPGELLTQMNVPIKLNAVKTSFTLRGIKPSETLGAPVLKTLSPNVIDLEFKARSEDNRQYFNLSGLERITGVSYSLSQDGVLIVGASAAMTSYPEIKWEKYALPELEKPFNLVWDHVLGDNADLSEEDALPSVSVISPTWFSLLDETGRTSNRGDVSYAAAAHAKGYRVWGLVSNGFKRGMTSKFLADKKAQDLFIANMLSYAAIYGLDGINIDFESVHNDDASRLTEFVRRFAAAGRTMGLAFSMDVMIPTKWSLCYQRKALSEIVDYIAVMTYDEHWRTSPKAGSTASLPWVGAALDGTLAQVPADKLLMGIPFYTREWRETRGKNGKTSLKSLALSMASVDERIASSGAQKKWLEP